MVRVSCSVMGIVLILCVSNIWKGLKVLLSSVRDMFTTLHCVNRSECLFNYHLVGPVFTN